MAASEKELTIRICGKADNSLNTVSDKVDRAFHKLTSAAKTLGVVGGTAAAGAVTAAVGIGKEYEAQMSTVQAISGATAAEYEQLSAKAQEMGRMTQFSASESAQAMEYMAMAGWKTDDMIGGIEGIMDLAAASGENLSTVSDIVTDALTAFNMSAEDSGHFADILAKASSNSNTNVSMMGETFKYVASVAGALGYSAEDTAVSVGLLANSGIKASQSGTIMRKLMSETAGGIELVSKAYAKHGEKTGRLKIQTANADGSMKDWSETVGRLREEFSKMTEEEQAANAESIGGKTAMSGLLAIVNASEKDYKKLTKQINNAAGATKEMANIRMDNLEGDIKLFQSALEGKGIELYDELKEPLRDLVQDATAWLDEIDVGRVVDDFRDFGGAVLEFSEPFLNVGEWMLENPEVVSGTLAGIGGALTAYKIADTLPIAADGIGALGKSLAAHPWVAAGALAAGAVAGIGTAAVVTQRKLKEASLEDHFGDISLSMKEINDVAANLVGGGRIKNIDKMFDSLDASEQLAEKMKKALGGIDEVKWKVSAGIKLDKDDMDSFEKNVKEYVSDAQDLIDKNGYTVNVATKVLFGNSKRGKELIRSDNEIFGALEMEAEGLANRINSTLEEAMEKGLTPDLQKVLDGYMEDLDKITYAKTEAEAEAKWDTLKAEFSGKELDADSYQRMQDKINKTVEEVEKGALEALEVSDATSNWQKNMEYISEEENEKEKEDNKKAYEKLVADAKRKGLDFQYNTLMDTYGETILASDYKDGDKSAIRELAEKMMEQAKDMDPEMYNKLQDISLAATPGAQNEFLAKIDKMYSQTPDLDYWGTAATKDAQQAVRDYQNTKSTQKNDSDASIGLPFMLSLFGAQQIGKEIDTAMENMLVDPAIEGGKNASHAIENTIKSELGNGINADVPIALRGTFSLTGNPFAGAQAGNGAAAGGQDAGSTETVKARMRRKRPVKMSPIPGHASGTISNRQHIAAVSEGDKLEAIIPIDGSERSRRLYEATGKLMGSPAGQQVVFSPHIEIHVSGGATKEDGRKISDEVERALEKAYRKMARDNARFRMR